MTHAATPFDRRGLLAACLVLGAVDLAFIDAVALPRVMAGARVRSPGEGHPPPTPPALRAGGEPAVAARAPLPESGLLPRVRAGEAGRGAPSQEGPPPVRPHSTPTIVPTPALELTIHFDTADASLAAPARAAVDQLAARAAGHPGWTLTVKGHADARGDAAFNDHLSEQRAVAVVARLEAAGLAPSRVHAEAFGASQPLSTRDDPASLRRNRRVEILIVRGGP